MLNTTKMQIRLDAAPDRVFEALTDSAAVAAWFAEYAGVDLAARTYNFWGKFTPDVPDKAAGVHPISELIPAKMLSFDWRLKGDDTRVTYTLYPDGGGTILTLRHAQIPGGAAVEAGSGSEDFWFLALENLRRYLDGKPSEARVDYTNPMRGHVRHETDIDAPAAAVFDILTNPDQLNRWIAADAKVQPEVGGDYNYGWMWEGQDAGAAKITEYLPNRKLSVHIAGNEQMDSPPTTVTWELAESGGKTRVIFTHSGFADDADVSGIFSGWRSFLNWVRSIAEYGSAWTPPLSLIPPGMPFYPKVMLEAQDRILDALKTS